jgi:hypothetical protein
MTKPRYALRDCVKVLCRGRRYTIGETRPDGFGLWENNGVLPVATYPGSLAGWYAVVDHFIALGDKPLPFELQRIHQRRRAS